MRRITALAAALAVAVLFVAVAGSSRAPTANAEKLTWRISEPIIVSGSQLGHFADLPVDRVAVWTLAGESWERVSSQVDQRDDDGNFVPEDGRNVLDDNDELVFMAANLGDERTGADSWPPGVSHALSPAEIAVTDPLQPDYVGHTYVFDSPPAAPGVPLVVFDEASTEIRSDAYVLGFATEDDGYFGLKRLSLMGDARDRVDRSKFRLTIPQYGEFTEESLGSMGGIGPVEPVIEGPVRLVMDASGSSTAYAARATLFSMDLGMEDIPLIPGLQLRLSLDFSPNVSGATYRAENIPSGVTIDGQPDTVRQLPFPMWREIVLDEGRLVTLAQGEPPPLLVRTYYKDDATPDEDDTGDKMSYGDNGIIASTFDGLVDVGFLGQMVALAPGEAVTAEDLAEQWANPIVVNVDVEAAPDANTIHLPLTIKLQ
jgi:hypothetical protein